VSDESKSILDKWATLVLTKDHIWEKNGEATPNQDHINHYQDIGYSEDIVLWNPPKDCIRMEFESTPEENRKWIAEIESAAKSLGYDYCITEHQGAKSPYFNMFNIKGIPLNEDNKAAKKLITDQLCPSQKARDSLDKTNLGWTLSPIIGHQHWKPKYHGAIHSILRGTHPLEHNNEYPKKFLTLIEKSKEQIAKPHPISEKELDWTTNFLLGFCMTNVLPPGDRHNVIEKNLAMLIYGRQDKTDIEKQYSSIQKQPLESLQGWYSGISSGTIKEVNVGELVNYIKRYDIPFEIPKTGTQEYKIVEREPDKDGWAKIESVPIKKPQQPPKEISDDLPEIILPHLGKLVSTFGEEVFIIVRDKKELFLRISENAIVKIDAVDFDLKVDKKLIKEHTKIMGFIRITPREFVTYAEKYIVPGSNIFNKDTKQVEFKRKTMGTEVASLLLESGECKKVLPKIDRVLSVPMPEIIDGKLEFPKAGYDERFYTWLSPDAPTIKEDLPIEVAKGVIEFVFNEFCFETEQDKTNAVAALLTPMLRGLYTRRTCRTPIFFYKANRPGAGKDYCADITGLVYFGESKTEPPITTGSRLMNDEEVGKKIMSLFKAGVLRFHSSNNKGRLESANLEALATLETYENRVLGQSVNLSFPNEMEISLSANTDIEYTEDLSRRCIFINLFLGMEDLNKRKFTNPDLHGKIRENRSLILSALYSFIKTWVGKGMPSGSKEFSSYPEWARVCGGVMESSGYMSPCISLAPASIGGDTKTQEVKAFFELAYGKWGESRFRKPELFAEFLPAISEGQTDGIFCGLFAELELERGSPKSKKKFTTILDGYIGRILGGLRLFKKDYANQRYAEYWINPCDGTEIPSITKNHTIMDFSDVFATSTTSTTINSSCLGNENVSKIGFLDRVEIEVFGVVEVVAGIFACLEKHSDGASVTTIYLDISEAFKRHLLVKNPLISSKELGQEMEVLESAIEKQLERLRNQGDIFEAKPGFYRKL
jgi:hypothetical protein